MAKHRHKRDLGPKVHAYFLARLARHPEETISGLCARIGLDRSIPMRWKSGTTPSLQSFLLVFNELDQLDLDAALPPAGRMEL